MGVFSQRPHDANVLQSCYFGGAAIFASTNLLTRSKPLCVNGWNGTITNLHLDETNPSLPVPPSQQDQAPSHDATGDGAKSNGFRAAISRGVMGMAALALASAALHL